ncbi:HlyD family secretion protein [Sulfitobacter marinus]|uniref:Membrane fusion protein (MFP) family protein n=1 Tax=Sulfitobacter marinus TaxID=394264 RepID=A0A1I6VBU1_9RHOB|nr:HlyD family type I secretion periplasmic adaptor subunit [Sulfitobacter marinus]SFT11196.1 HlyD family secretion protein [Sulfitobacter marinus]
MHIEEQNAPKTSLATLTLAGITVAFVLVVMLGGWAARTKISGAVIARGQVEVAGKPKIVQTLDGGILAEILVADGDHVAKGQVLARLDSTQLQINLDMARTRLAAALTLRARLEAERMGADDLVFDYADLPMPAQHLGDVIRKAEDRQRDIFEARQDMRRGMEKQMHGHLADLDTQAQGISGQMKALERQLSFVQSDLASINALLAKGLSRRDKLTEALRRQAALQGNLAERQAELASVNNHRREIAINADQEERALQEKTATDLRELFVEIEELTLAIVTREAQLQRVELRAPANGIVHELQMTTLGGVIPAGGTLLHVIPQDAGLAFEVRVPPRDINKVRREQPAQIVMTALDPQKTPKLAGRVAAVSPETITDPITAQPFYRVAVHIAPEELGRLPHVEKLIAGMPLEVFLQTREKTVLSYLTEPLMAQLSHGFRE